HGGSIVPGGRLDIDFIKQSRTRDGSDRCAVQCDATRQSKSPLRRLLLEVAANVQQRFFQALLKSGCNIPVLVADRLISFAPRSQCFIEKTPRRPIVLALLASMVQCENRNPNGTVG